MSATPGPQRLTAEMQRFVEATPADGPSVELLERLRAGDRTHSRLTAEAPTRRWGVAVVAAAVVAAVVLALGAGLPRLVGDPAPVADGAGDRGARLVGAIPSRVYEPSRWMPVDPAPGHAAAIRTIDDRARFWGGNRDGITVISAVTGRYTWLDLPENRGIGLVSLSPTGRWVAFWAQRDDELPDTETDLVIYDLTDGTSVAIRPERTPRGVSESEPLWIDADTVATEVGAISARGRVVLSYRPTLLVDAETGETAQAPRGSPIRKFLPTNNVAIGGALAGGTRPQSFAFVGDDGETVRRLQGVQPDDTESVALTPSGERLVWIDNGTERSRDFRFVHVAAATRPGEPGGTQTDLRLEGYRIFDLLGWADESAVVGLLGRDQGGSTVIGSVDIDSGEVTELVTAPGGNFGDFASALWERRTVDRPEPGWRLNPRSVPISAGLALIGLLYVRFGIRKQGAGEADRAS